MSYLKTAAVAALVSAAAFGATLSAANAGGKHHKHHHFFHHHHYGAGPAVVIGVGPSYSCKHWLRKYKSTGKKFFLDRYYGCVYY